MPFGCEGVVARCVMGFTPDCQAFGALFRLDMSVFSLLVESKEGMDDESGDIGGCWHRKRVCGN